MSYVAKDPEHGRACHVLECGGGLAEDVVTTIGQAFELRYKQYLKKQPKAMQFPDRSVVLFCHDFCKLLYQINFVIHL